MTRETLILETADGVVLEGELTLPNSEAWAAAVVTHPHPLYGGDMYNNVTAALFAGLAAAGVTVVRFNFRGVGASGGEHDHGRSESLDVAAAVHALDEVVDAGLPMVIAGYSFGADVAACVTVARVDGWYLVAPPLRVVPVEEMLCAHDPRPKRLAVPEHDQFNPPTAAAERVAGWVNTSLRAIEMGDHFLAGRTATVVEDCIAFCHDVEG